MLDERKTAILSAVVREYVATAQPVGSAHVADSTGLGVSSATVRNEMVILEQEGFLTQPHTSAGRVPTDKGYRFFVDHMAAPRRVDAVTTQQVSEFFAAAHGRIEELMHQTTDLLATLTKNAAVVLGPSAQVATVRSVQLVRLSTATAAVVVVFTSGEVTNDVVTLDEATSDGDVALAEMFLSREMDGRHLADLANIADHERDEVNNVVRRVRDQLATVDDDAHVYVGGASTVAEAFDAVDVVRKVLHTLDQQFVVVSLVRDIVERGMTVAIGGEHGVEPLAACSVVVAPVVVDGEQLGSVGVLGPTRMNYPQAIATVDIVSDRLGRRLGEN